MTIQADFIINGVPYSYKRPYSLLDRNYKDEGYAYFLERIPNTNYGLFEINIFKDEYSDRLLNDGYVAIYSCTEQVNPESVLDASIQITGQ